MSIYVSEVFKSPTIFVLLLISSFIAVSIFLMYWGAPILGPYIFIIVISSLDWSLDHYVVSFLVTFFILKSILSHMRIATPAFFWFPFAWNIFFHPLTFSLYVSLGLKWASCRQHIDVSCFCIHSSSLCLLVGAFSPVTFMVIIDMFVPITVFLVVLGLFL